MSQRDKDQIKEQLVSVWTSIRKAVPPVHKEGHVFIAVFAIVTLLLAWMHWNFLFAIGLALTLWCIAFFRDAPRFTPVDPDLIVSPADGTIQAVGDAIPPLELDLGDAPLTRVAIFMSVFDGHINRTPVTGKISRVVYSPGVFLNAELDKASEDNERNALVIESGDRKIGVVQIAGLVARRIVCFVKEGESVTAGQRIGLIRFGSRVDVYLPDGAHPVVTRGQKTIAGETVLAEFNRAVTRTFKEQ